MKQLMAILGAVTLVSLFNHPAALADTTTEPCKDQPNAGQYSQDCDKAKEQTPKIIAQKQADKKTTVDTSQTDEVNCSDTPYNSPLCNN